MTTTFNAAATKTVGVNATNFEFTFTRLERIAFGPGKITTLGAELERMGATRALVATGKTLGASWMDICALGWQERSSSAATSALLPIASSGTMCSGQGPIACAPTTYSRNICRDCRSVPHTRVHFPT
jgi:hypothetical protein